MIRPASLFRGGIAALVLFLAAFPVMAASGGLTALVEVPAPRDAISAEQLREIRAAIAEYEEKRGGVKEAEGPFLLPFFPQAGVLGKDLFLTNYTDLDPARDRIRDWDCSGFTYDGHQGHDSIIRTFREQAIGVPVFAALGGTVIETHDGEPDMNVEWVEGNQANYVVIDHGGGYLGLYLHFRQGSVAVVPGQVVTAGTQLGLTGSSGFSNWPHLHFETWKDRQWFEPSAGPCRTGESFWISQQPVARDFYVSDFFMTLDDLFIPDRLSLLLDSAPRTAMFVKGRQTVSQRVDLRNLPAGSTFLLRVLTPRRQVAVQAAGLFGNPVDYPIAFGTFFFTTDLDTPGTWRYQLEINGGLAVDVPFQVVATERQRKNRKPNAVKTRLTPAKPVEGQVMTCEVQTSLITEDPDFDLVGYRYEWKVNNRVVRAVTSAALADLLPAGTALPKDKVSCRVVVSDRP
jgi:murein DD-endopeptidase MepM/ murein hydrolase activator NlpD